MLDCYSRRWPLAFCLAPSWLASCCWEIIIQNNFVILAGRLRKVASNKTLQISMVLPSAKKILVAVSGGVDSMVLLHQLHASLGKNRGQILVAHFNHQLRGRASDADEKLVRQTAAVLGMKCFVGTADVKQFAATAKISTEMAARKLRHEFLARIALAQKIKNVALAHHADDQVELFFLRLLRGAGNDGLAGMKWQSPSPADKKITLIRPLLNWSKNDLLNFARDQKIKFREDGSNVSRDFLRNRIRHELLPLLRKNYQSGLDKIILRTMAIIGAESELVSELAEIKVECFDDLPVALQRRKLQQQLLAAGVPLDFDLIEQLRSNAGNWISTGAKVAVTRDAAGEINLRREVSPEFNPAEIKVKLTVRAKNTEFAGQKLAWKVMPMKRWKLPNQKTGVENLTQKKWVMKLFCDIGVRVTAFNRWE